MKPNASIIANLAFIRPGDSKTTSHTSVKEGDYPGITHDSTDEEILKAVATKATEWFIEDAVERVLVSRPRFHALTYAEMGSSVGITIYTVKKTEIEVVPA